MPTMDADDDLSDFYSAGGENGYVIKKYQLALMRAVAEKQRLGMSVEEAASAVSRETGKFIKAIRGDIGVTFKFHEEP